MADKSDEFPPDWGNWLAKRSYLFTLLVTLLFAAGAVIFVLLR